MARVLVTGGSGQLGFELKLISGKCAITPSRSELDIEDASAINTVIGIKPDLVIHCAAETRVDYCEEHPDEAYSCNVIGTQHIATACRELDIPLVYISTDYVFDGSKDTPYIETDPVQAINVYGQTKLKGERVVRELIPLKHYIVRPGWLYGFVRFEKTNFVRTVLKLAADDRPIRMVTTQVGSPTSSHDVAHAILQLIKTTEFGIYHLAAQGYCSRYELAKKILEYVGRGDIEVEPIEDFPQRAARPAFTALENVRARDLGIELKSWEVALKEFISRVKRTYKFTPGGFLWP